MPPRQRDGDVVGGARLEGGRAAAIRDDHVVTIYAVHDEGPRPYLAMEYIPGVTLESVSAMARRCRLTRPCGSASRSPTVWRPPTTRAWSTGTLPGDVAQVLARVPAETPEPSRAMNPAVPPWLCDLLARLHAPEPGDRIASAREVGMRLGSGLAALQLPPRDVGAVLWAWPA